MVLSGFLSLSFLVRVKFPATLREAPSSSPAHRLGLSHLWGMRDRRGQGGTRRVSGARKYPLQAQVRRADRENRVPSQEAQT